MFDTFVCSSNAWVLLLSLCFLQYFVLDAKQGDTICLGKGGTGCGAVVESHKVRPYCDFHCSLQRTEQRCFAHVITGARGQFVLQR